MRARANLLAAAALAAAAFDGFAQPAYEPPEPRRSYAPEPPFRPFDPPRPSRHHNARKKKGKRK